MVQVTWERMTSAQNLKGDNFHSLRNFEKNHLGAKVCLLETQEVLVELAQLIGWSPRVWEILSYAFSKQLTRNQIWNLKAIPPERHFDFYCAAEIYKRGVACFPKTEIPIFEDQKQSKGYYEIELNQLPLNDAGFDIIDSNVFSIWKNDFIFSGNRIQIKTEEKEKNLATILEILKKWKELGKPNKWRIVGGGLLLDLAQFAASLVNCQTYLYPTTLLAMVDASIGGKCGVNLNHYGKNQIGRFYFPCKIVIWPNWLKSLPDRELLSGVGECLKHAMIIGNQNLFNNIVTAVSTRPNNSGIYFSEQLIDLIEVKAKICQMDPFETNVRNFLNLGHTLAHALEAEALERNHTIPHGQAVAYGLQFSLLIAKELSEISHEDFVYYWQGILNTKIIGNPSQLLSLSKEHLLSEAYFERLLKFIQQDKKHKKSQESLQADLQPSLQWIIPCTNITSSLYAVKQVSIDTRKIRKIWHNEYSRFLSEFEF